MTISGMGRGMGGECINQIFYTLLLFYYIACSVPSPSSVSTAACCSMKTPAAAASLARSDMLLCQVQMAT